MDFSPVYQHVVELMMLVLTASVTIGVAYLRSWANEKIKQDEFKNSLMVTLDGVETAVKKSIATLGDSAKEAVKDGKVTKEELEALRATALKDIQENLTPMAKERLQAHIMDVDKYIQDKVTTAVEDALQNAVKPQPVLDPPDQYKASVVA